MKQSQKTRFTAPVIVFMVFFLASTYIHAAGTQSGYQLLADIPTIVAKDKSVGITLVDYMKGLFVAVIGLAIVLAVVQLVIGGIEYVAAANPNAKSDAKSRILGAIGGLLLILSAWIVLNALNPKLLNVGLNLEKVAVFGNDGGIDPLNPFQVCSITINKDGSCGSETCYSGTGATDEEKAKDCFNKEAEWQKTQKNCSDVKDGEADLKCISKSCTSTTHAYPKSCKAPTTKGCPATKEEYIAGDNAIRATLESHDVKVKSNQCTYCGQKGCTSVYGLPESAINGLITLKAACGCEVVVTGGTEAGHKTHGIGKPIVDLRHTSSLDAFLKNVVCAKSGRNVYGHNGNHYWDEDPAHFHVTYGISQC